MVQPDDEAERRFAGDRCCRCRQCKNGEGAGRENEKPPGRGYLRRYVVGRNRPRAAEILQFVVAVDVDPKMVTDMELLELRPQAFVVHLDVVDLTAVGIGLANQTCA